jgi:hypothetical protein
MPRFRPAARVPTRERLPEGAGPGSGKVARGMHHAPFGRKFRRVGENGIAYLQPRITYYANTNTVA